LLFRAREDDRDPESDGDKLRSPTMD